MEEHRERALAMVTAWLTSSADALTLARPDPRTNPTLAADTGDFLALLSATAISCWARAINVDPADLFRDLALSLHDESRIVEPQ